MIDPTGSVASGSVPPGSVPPGPVEARSPVFAVADRYVTELTALDPILGTELGVAGCDDRLTDFSPDGVAGRADLARRALDEVAGLPCHDDADRVAAAVMRERLGSLLARHEAGDDLRDLSVFGVPSTVRAVFDLMPADTPDAREDARRRMLAVPASLESWRRALAAGRDRGLLADRRQAHAVADQAATFAGDAERGWFRGWADRVAAGSDDAEPLAAAAAVADEAFAATARWLREDYAPTAAPTDGVGAERYARASRDCNGADLDLDETYAWGWAELERITTRMRDVAGRILPGADLATTKAHLDTDDRYAIHGTDALVAFLEDLTARATDGMADTHFDIDPRVRTCEVRLAPEGSAAAPYYLPPSEDLRRPGSTWYPTMGRDRFPRWWLVSVWYHEAVPGHHLQISRTILERDRLSRFQRTVGWTSGHGEGWALYAERLMDELGWFADPAEEMGFLSAQAMRAARVVVDIGLHLGRSVPDDVDDETAGRRLDADVALDLMRRRALLDDAFARSEVDRYLGVPGQAISYKVGERFWLEARAGARERRGAAFDLKDWHDHALRLGPMGLDPFRDEMARY